MTGVAGAPLIPLAGMGCRISDIQAHNYAGLLARRSCNSCKTSPSLPSLLAAKFLGHQLPTLAATNSVGNMKTLAVAVPENQNGNC
jgi:hypothetical protein